MVFCYRVLGHVGRILIKNPYKYILYPWKTVVIYLKILNHVQSSRLEELSEGYKGYYNANATFCSIFGFTMKLLVNSAAKGEQTHINEYSGVTLPSCRGTCQWFTNYSRNRSSDQVDNFYIRKVDGERHRWILGLGNLRILVKGNDAENFTLNFNVSCCHLQLAKYFC